MAEVVAASDALPGRRVEESSHAVPLALLRRTVGGSIVLAAAYYGAAKIGYQFEFAGPVAAIVCFPVGIGIAFLYLGGLWLLPGVIVGDLLANDYGALPLGSALGQTCGNVLEVAVAALLLRRLVRRGSPLETVADVGGMVVAIVAGTILSASIGSLSLRLGEVVKTSAIPEVWRTWWLGDTSGALVIVPLALAWGHGLPRWSRRRWIEAGIVLLAVVFATELAFRSARPLVYLVFPALIWAALRFGQRGATVALAVAAALTVWNTTHFDGPFVYHSITESVLTTQLYIAVAALSTLLLAAVVSEREQFSRRLGVSRAEVFHVADTERRRIERNLHDGAQQRLISLAVNLHTAAKRTEEFPEEGPALLRAAESELGLAFDELRELAHGIHPSVLRDLGLADALRSLAAHSTIPIEFVELQSPGLPENVEVTAYFVFAEAVTNAQKHAHASALQVRIRLARDVLHVEIADDGAGGAVERSGSGLQGIRERVEAAGGTFRLHSATGQGTRIAAAIPVRPA